MNRQIVRRMGFTVLSMLLFAGSDAWAANPQFGMIGLAAGQTLRLNVVAYPPDPCNAVIGFLDSNGQLPQPDPSKIVSLSPGQAAFVDIKAAALGIQFGRRMELQPVVTLIPIADAVSVCSASAEMFDSFTGGSQVAIPQPDPNLPNTNPLFGMVGIGAGQVLRLNVVAWPPDPCNAVIGFLDSNGQLPQPDPGKTVSLNPGQATFIDLPAGALGILFGQRMEFQPVVILNPANVTACQATVEVFDVFTRRTSAYMLPQPNPN